VTLVNLFVDVFLPFGVQRKQLSAREMAAYRGPFLTRAAREPTHILPRQALAAHDYLARVYEDLPKLASLPALLVWGDRDQALAAKQRRRFEGLFPHHRTVLLRGASHFIQEDAPEEIVAALRAWWDDCVEGARFASARRTS
jgi:haloalkane dehalogenase